MTRILLRLCLYVGTLVQATAPIGTPQYVVLAGHVLYKTGAPVRNAEVEMHFYAPMSGIKPQPQKTDESGAFTLQTPPFGEGVISASKESEGYPNAALAYYERAAYKSIRQVDIKPDTKLDEIVLIFGDPDATIQFTIQAADTRDAVRNARVAVDLLSQPNVAGSYSATREGTFRFVLPKRPVSVRITAPGYVEWSYVDEQGRMSLQMKPGTHQQKLVLLTRVK